MQAYHLNCSREYEGQVEVVAEFPQFVDGVCEKCGVKLPPLNKLVHTYPPGDGFFYSFVNPDNKEHYEEIGLKR